MERKLIAGALEPVAEAASGRTAPFRCSPLSLRAPGPPGHHSPPPSSLLVSHPDSALTVVSLALKESGAYVAGTALLVIEFGLRSPRSCGSDGPTSRRGFALGSSGPPSPIFA
jgi:hypothetical protein